MKLLQSIPTQKFEKSKKSIWDYTSMQHTLAGVLQRF